PAVAARAAAAAAVAAGAADRRGADARLPGAGAVGAGGRRRRQDRDAGLHHAVLGGGRGLGGAARAPVAGAFDRFGHRVRRADAGAVAGAGFAAERAAGHRRRPVLGDRHRAEQTVVHAGRGARALAERLADAGRHDRAGAGGAAGGGAGGAVDARLRGGGALQ